MPTQVNRTEETMTTMYEIIICVRGASLGGGRTRVPGAGAHVLYPYCAPVPRDRRCAVCGQLCDAGNLPHPGHTAKRAICSYLEQN